MIVERIETMLPSIMPTLVQTHINLARTAYNKYQEDFEFGYYIEFSKYAARVARSLKIDLSVAEQHIAYEQ